MPPKFEITPGVYIGEGCPVYLIAEIGQNHQGNIAIAKQLILEAKKNGANCVKFQKSDLYAKFTKQALNRPYSSSNSWGATYAAHKQRLEFSKSQFLLLQQFATQHDITFTASGMDIPSVNFLCDQLRVPFLKIGSGDANNIPLLEHAARKGVPLVISTGMVDMQMVKLIHRIVTSVHQKVVIMHCVSAYPLPLDAANLRVLQTYQQHFPDVVIGYSGHETDEEVCIAAVALGAKVIERHLTLDRRLKGSDHACSLTPPMFGKMAAALRRVTAALGSAVKQRQQCEAACARKLGKSLVMATSVGRGAQLRPSDLTAKVAEPPGVDAALYYKFVGRYLHCGIQGDECIWMDDIIDGVERQLIQKDATCPDIIASISASPDLKGTSIRRRRNSC